MTVPTLSFSMQEHGYVPILLTRRAERRAVQDTPQPLKESITPLWVVAPVPYDWDNDEPAKSVAEHIQDVGTDLARTWGVTPAFVDTDYLDDALISDRHPLEIIVADAAGLGLPLIPVTGPDRSPEHHAAVATVAAGGGLSPGGACLRISRADALNLQAPPAQRNWDVDDLLSTLGLNPDQVDLVFDFEDKVEDPLATATLMRAILIAFPHLADWRSVTFAGTSIPASMQGVQTNAVSRFDRPEWSAYLDLLRGPALPRTLRFGDYGVQHPDLPTDVNPRFLRVFSQIRYATNDGWLIARGLELKRAGYGHVTQLAQLLIAQPEYAGPAFSWGDAWLSNCANGTTTPGNPETWRRVGTSHHLAHVSQQLAVTVGFPAP